MNPASKSQFPQKKRIFLVDDAAFSRQGVIDFIDKQPGMRICGAAGSPCQALDVIPRAQPELVIVDIGLRTGDGIALVRDLDHQWPGLPILVFSSLDEKEQALRCLRAGARGYLMKGATPTEVLTAIETVIAGRLYVSVAFLERLVELAIQSREALSETSAQPYSGLRLSAREQEVLEAIGAGLPTREIAVRLHLSGKTVESYRENLKFKLQLRSGRELIDFARQNRGRIQEIAGVTNSQVRGG